MHLAYVSSIVFNGTLLDNADDEALLLIPETSAEVVDETHHVSSAVELDLPLPRQHHRRRPLEEGEHEAVEVAVEQHVDARRNHHKHDHEALGERDVPDRRDDGGDRAAGMRG